MLERYYAVTRKALNSQLNTDNDDFESGGFFSHCDWLHIEIGYFAHYRCLVTSSTILTASFIRSVYFYLPKREVDKKIYWLTKRELLRKLSPQQAVLYSLKGFNL